MNLYQEQILDHYEHPRHRGKLTEPSGSAQADNPLCGDALSCQVRIEHGTLADIAFDGHGCAISQAAASMLAEFVSGKPVERVTALTVEDLVALLGIPLSPTRLKCGLLSLEVLHRALATDAAEPTHRKSDPDPGWDQGREP